MDAQTDSMSNAGSEYGQATAPEVDDGMYTGAPPPHFASPGDELDDLQDPASGLDDPHSEVTSLVPAAADPDLTQEESARRVQEVLANFKTGMAFDDAERTMVLEFGVLAILERRIAHRAEDILAPNVAAVLHTEVRRAIHEAVVSNPMLSKNERSSDSLDAREAMLLKLEKTLESRTTTLMTELKRADAKGIKEFFDQMYGAIDAEQRRLAQMKKNLAPPTLGQTIFDGLKAAFHGSGNELVGDARRHRNKQLTTAVEDLTSFAKELKEKAGDAAWERSHGAMARRGVSQLTRQVEDLTKSVADQIDAPALRKNLDSVKDLLDDASKNSVDPEHKKALEQMVKNLHEMVKALISAVGRVFGHGESAPKPA